MLLVRLYFSQFHSCDYDMLLKLPNLFLSKEAVIKVLLVQNLNHAPMVTRITLKK